jgi:hypothetical protein
MPNHTFIWGFSNSGVGNTVETCDSVPIHIIPLNGSTGVPPYSILAFEVGGTVTNYTNAGSDPDNLNWVVGHQGSTYPFHVQICGRR